MDAGAEGDGQSVPRLEQARAALGEIGLGETEFGVESGRHRLGQQRTTQQGPAHEMRLMGPQFVAQTCDERCKVSRAAEEPVQVEPRPGVIAGFEPEVSTSAAYEGEKLGKRGLRRHRFGSEPNRLSASGMKSSQR
jgi:hypothetical protein